MKKMIVTKNMSSNNAVMLMSKNCDGPRKKLLALVDVVGRDPDEYVKRRGEAHVVVIWDWECKCKRSCVMLFVYV